jgi:hypothetical protein
MYAYQQTLVAKTTTNALRPAFEQLAGKIGGECPGVLAAAPRRGFLETAFGPSPSPPSSPPPARRLAEDTRAERQLTDLRYELLRTFEARSKQIERPATEAFVDAVKSLQWSDPVITQQLAVELAELEESLDATQPDVCEDMRAWASSGFKTLSPATKTLVRKREEAEHVVATVNGVPTVTPPVSALLMKYENASDRTLEQKTNRLAQGGLAVIRSIVEILARLDGTLGLSRTRELLPKATSSRVIAHGRTAAGEKFVAKLERKKQGSGSSGVSGCSLELSIAEPSRPGRGPSIIQIGPGFTTCVARSRETYGPSVDCSSGRLTITANTPPNVRSVRLRLSNGKEITSRAIFVPRKLGGPFGLYYQVVRGPSPIAVSLVELNEHGKAVRAAALPHIVECTKNPLKYLPSGLRTLVRDKVPGGPSFTIVGEHYRFLGRTYFELKLQLEQSIYGNFPGGSASAVLGQPNPLRRALGWRSETGCKPHPFRIIYGLFTNPSDAVLIRYAGQLVPLKRVQIPASMHAGGVLVYTAPPSLPTELVLQTATGKTIATESLQELATETQERCEGEEEGPSASSAP